MRADRVKMRILQKINANAGRQERSFEIRTSHSRGPLPHIKKMKIRLSNNMTMKLRGLLE